jgi:transcriptional regulator with XRE-family HTH domain
MLAISSGLCQDLPMTRERGEDSNTGTLGQHLAAIRADRGYSLRQVEEMANRIISNAYLSQIETGKVRHPSPNVLHALAEVYRTNYGQLMARAGYMNTTSVRNAQSGRISTLASLNVSQAEELELIEYLKFRRELSK